MKLCSLLCVLLGTSSVKAFLPPGLHTVLGTSSGFRQRALSRKGQAEMRCGKAASPVNTAETLQRTSELAIEGIGNAKKLALLGSTVCQTRMAVKIECRMVAICRAQKLFGRPHSLVGAMHVRNPVEGSATAGQHANLYLRKRKYVPQ